MCMTSSMGTRARVRLLASCLSLFTLGPPASAQTETEPVPADVGTPSAPSLSLPLGATRLHLWYGPNLDVGGSDDLGRPWTSALVIRANAIDPSAAAWDHGPRAPFAVGNAEVSHGFGARTELGVRAGVSTYPGATYSFGAVIRTTSIVGPRIAFGLRAAVNADLDGSPSASLEFPLRIVHRRLTIDTGLEASLVGRRLRAYVPGRPYWDNWHGFGSVDAPIALTYVHPRVRAGGHASAGLVVDPVGLAPVFVVGAHGSATLFPLRFPIDVHLAITLDLVPGDSPMVHGRGVLGIGKRWP